MKARHAFFALATLSIFGGVVFADTTLFYVEVKSGGAAPVSVESPVETPGNDATEAVEEESLEWQVRAIPDVTLDLYWEGVFVKSVTTNEQAYATFETDHALGLYVLQFVDPEGALIQEVYELSSEEESEISLVMKPSLYADSDEENLYFYGFFLPSATVEFSLVGSSMEATQLSMTDERGLYAFAVPISSFVYGDYQLNVKGSYGAAFYASDPLVFEYVPEPHDPGYVEYMESKGMEAKMEQAPVLEEALVVEESMEQVLEEAVEADLEESVEEVKPVSLPEKVQTVVQEAVQWLLGQENVQPSRVEEGMVSSLSQPEVLPSPQVNQKTAQALTHLCPNLVWIDKNKDCRVNQRDVFLLRETSQVQLEDVSGDGEVTLQDYSILAYYWTY